MKFFEFRLAACFAIWAFSGIFSWAYAEEERWAKENEAIPRVAPSAFEQLPSPVVKELDRRGCTVPQSGVLGQRPTHAKQSILNCAFTKSGKPRCQETFQRKKIKPHNVTSGEFLKPGQTDWAVLCSVNKKSAILVFPGGSDQDVRVIGEFANDWIWLDRMSDGRVRFTRKVVDAPQRYLKNFLTYFEEPGLQSIDHDGVRDMTESSSEMLYWHEGKWLPVDEDSRH